MTASIGVVASSLRLLMQLALASLAHAQTFVAISAMPASRQFCVGDVISYTASLQVIDHNPQNQSDVTIENVFLIGPSGFALQIVNGEYAKTSSFQIYTVPESIRGMVDLFLRGTAFYSSNPNELLVSLDSSPTFSIASSCPSSSPSSTATTTSSPSLSTSLPSASTSSSASGSDSIPSSSLPTTATRSPTSSIVSDTRDPAIGPSTSSAQPGTQTGVDPAPAASSGLSAGAVAGIAAGFALVATLSVAVFILYVQAKRRKQSGASSRKLLFGDFGLGNRGGGDSHEQPEPTPLAAASTHQTDTNTVADTSPPFIVTQLFTPHQETSVDRAQVPAAAPTMFWRTSEQIDYLIPMSVTPTPRPASPHAFAASNASSAYAASTASVDSKPAKNDIRAATPAASRGSRTPEPPPPSEPAAITSNAASLPEQPTLFSGVQDVVEALAAAGGGSGGSDGGSLKRSTTKAPMADRSWRRWTPAEVASALSGEGVASSTVSLFLANEIDGLVLRSVDDAFLTEELSISGAAEREAVMAAVRRVRRDDDDEGGEEGEFGSQRMFESEGRPPPYLA